MPDSVASSKTKPSYDVTELVVIDNVTGLAWQREAPATFAASACAAEDGCTWEEAKAYCHELAIGARHEFRLPTKIELESLVDDTQRDVPIDPQAFPDARGDILWTASLLADVKDRAWIVAFSNGVTFAASTAETLRVRCVQTERKASCLAGPQYAVDSESMPATVADARTGLIWQQIVAGAKRDQPGAKAYCASLGADWRLPTKKELLTLVDAAVGLGGPVPAIAPEFAGTPIDTNFWSGTPAANNSRYGWLVNVSGPAIVSAQAVLARVRCVR